MEQAEDILRKLTITSNYKGYKQAACCINLLMENNNYSTNLMKGLYSETARRCNTTVQCVERNLRTIIEIVWNSDGKNYLDEIARYHLIEKPKPGEFLDTISYYLVRKEEGNKDKELLPN